MTSPSEQDILLEQAVREYERDGLVSSSTFCAMTIVGMDAEAIIDDIEDEVS